MTVPANDRRIQYTATALQTVFPYDFEIFDDDDIIVQQTIFTTGLTETLTKTTDYIVSGVGELTGGNITLVSGASVNDIITITGNTPTSRSTDFTQSGDLLADDLNEQFDRLIQIQQQNDNETSRAMLLDNADPKSSMTLPISSELANNFLGFDENGDPIVATGITGVPVTPYIATLFDDVSALEARGTLGLDTTDDVEFNDLIANDISCSQITASTYVGLPQASEILEGIVERATQAELLAGVDTDKFFSPANLLGLFNACTRSADGTIRIPCNVGGAFDEIIIQMGQIAINANITTTSARTDAPNLTFPNAVLDVFPTIYLDGGSAPDIIVRWNKASTTTSSLAFLLREVNNVAQTGNWGITWLAIGY